MLKTCTGCHKEKPFSEFYWMQYLKHPRFCTRCKECEHKKVYRWQKANSFKQNHRIKFDSDPEYRKRKRARAKVNYEIWAGKITKPKNCEVCGSNGLMTAHHYLGYERDHWLDIQWLCRECHGISGNSYKLKENHTEYRAEL